MRVQVHVTMEIHYKEKELDFGIRTLFVSIKFLGKAYCFIT